MTHEQLRAESKESLAGIRVIVFDLDGTLYQDTPELREVIRTGIYQRMAETLEISVEEAKEAFEVNYQETGSATKTLSHFGLDGVQLMNEVFSETDFDGYLSKDPGLTAMLEQLSRHFRLVLLTNNRRFHAERKLLAIGIDPSLFEKIIATHDLGFFKPDKQVFERVLAETGLPPEGHLYVGDNEKTDIAPAKEVGMRTALVWGESAKADVSLATIYDLTRILQPWGLPPFEKREFSSATKEALRRAGGGRGAGGRPAGEMPGGLPRNR